MRRSVITLLVGALTAMGLGIAPGAVATAAARTVADDTRTDTVADVRPASAPEAPAGLDCYSLQSHERARQATLDGGFTAEIVPVAVRVAEGPIADAMHVADEGIRMDATLEGIRGVKLLREGGRITAASASQICDGASGVVVVNDRGLKAMGVHPLARVHHMTVIGGDPVIMLEAPLPATHHALKKAGMTIDDIDLFEVNEAFASVPLAWLQDTGADPARLNVNGGAIAMGHPLGASGTRLMATLVHALQARGKRYGLQTMCEGGGQANVTIVERLRA